jgi:thioredoxin 1
MTVKNATTDTFDDLIQSDEPVVVDFWAEWCVWCKKLAPVFDELEKKHGKKLRFVKVNVGEEKDLAERFGISSLPTLKYFCSGREVGEEIGAPPKDELEASMKRIIEKHKECLASSSAMR